MEERWSNRLVQLDRDHPGFRDPEYRTRRDAIARVALEYRGGPVPEVPYTAAEHEVWRVVWERLAPLHRARACREYLEVSEALALPRARIPQLAELNPRLRAATGFAMLPVAGLIEGGAFLARLGEGVFLSTQYMRHPSAPLYTPEPDVVHELIGHAATLIHPEIARLSRLLGRAAQRADRAGVLALERVYWYSLEFGAVEEAGEVKAFGAGILSSAGELERFRLASTLLPFDATRMAETPYDPTDYQPRVFVAPSFAALTEALTSWVRERFGVVDAA